MFYPAALPSDVTSHKGDDINRREMYLLGEDDTWRRSGYVFMCIRKSVNATTEKQRRL